MTDIPVDDTYVFHIGKDLTPEQIDNIASQLKAIKNYPSRILILEKGEGTILKPLGETLEEKLHDLLTRLDQTVVGFLKDYPGIDDGKFVAMGASYLVGKARECLWSRVKTGGAEESDLQRFDEWAAKGLKLGRQQVKDFAYDAILLEKVLKDGSDV